MGFGKSLKKSFKKLGVSKVYGAINPIWGAGASGIRKLTGLSGDQQLMMAAGIGGAAGLAGRGHPSATGYGPGGIPLASASNTAGGSNGFDWMGNLLPGVIPGIADYFGGREARDASLSSAREQMAFQERMSSTAHQREVSDLKAAGLNPALSANHGASTPAGAAIDAENIMGSAVATAQQARQVHEGIKETRGRVENLRAQAALTRTENIKAQEDALNSARQGFLLESQFPEADAERAFWEQHGAGHKKWQKRWEMIRPAVGTARDIGIGYGASRGFLKNSERRGKPRTSGPYRDLR